MNFAGTWISYPFNQSGFVHHGLSPARSDINDNEHFIHQCGKSGGALHVTDPRSLTKALTGALASGKPELINCVIDPTAAPRVVICRISIRRARSAKDR
jgi:thiamine pyrophosphate-dependent acetolactate synthase large subunit-like protein